MALHDYKKMVSGMEMLVEPTTPTENRQPSSAGSRSDTFRSVTSPLPKKWNLQTITTRTPLFCCDNCNDCNDFMTNKEPFADFIDAAARGIATGEPWAQIVIHSVEHLIELFPSLETSNPKLSAWYFVCLKPANEYREVNRDFFVYFQENRQATFVMSTWLTCTQLQHGYQLSRFECTEVVKEGLGLKDAELSPKQFSREKRKIMARKISYGRNDQIEELAQQCEEGEH